MYAPRFPSWAVPKASTMWRGVSRLASWVLLLVFLHAALSEALVVTPPTDYARSQKEPGMEEPAMSKEEWRGYSTLFAQRMSSLLSDASQMLPRAKDVQQRRWLQAFVHRLTQLVMELERNTFLPWMPPVFSSVHESSHQQEQTVPTTGQISPPPSPVLVRGTRTTTPGPSISEEHDMVKSEVVTVPNIVPDEDDNDILAWQLHGRRHRQKTSATTLRPTPETVRATTETYSLDSGRHVSLRPTTPLAARDTPILLGKAKRQAEFTSSAENVQKTFKHVDVESSVVGARTLAAKKQYRTSTVMPRSLVSSGALVTWASGSGKSATDDESSSSVDDLVSQLERGKFPPDR
uniref:Putative conserved secreted protein synganglion overexpressed n=1 Tax=Rhipicephalus microplus TaxID=6941 RepID=A0A6M2D4H4_RHIMP